MVTTGRICETARLYDSTDFSLRELLAFIVGSDGTASQIINHFDSWEEMSQATIPQLLAIKGVGPVRAGRLFAAFALGRRELPRELRAVIRSPENAYELLKDLRHETREVFRAVVLNSKNRVIRVATISIGTLNASIVHPREVFRAALAWNGAAIILGHNHPTGVSTPSQEDIAITKRLVKAGEIVGIQVLDHIIVGDGRFQSLKELGVL